MKVIILLPIALGYGLDNWGFKSW